MHSSTCILNIDYLFFRFQKILMIQVRLMIQVMMTQWVKVLKDQSTNGKTTASRLQASIKVQIYLSYRLYITVAQPSKNFAAKYSVLVCKYLQKWTMNVNKFVFSVYKI